MSSDTSTPYYGPVGETSSDILLEKTFMASGYLTGVGFGVQFVMYLLCTRALWLRKPKTPSTWFLLGYIFVLNAINTIWTGTSAYGLQLTFIDNRNYPGGPLAFLGIEFSIWQNILSLASLISGNVLADILLLWRCYVIWAATMGKRAFLVMVIPTLLLLASIATSCLFAYETVSPSGFFSKITANFALPYFALSLSLNILLTIMIVFKMSIQKLKGRAIFGEQYGRHYTSISTMFIESAALYCLFSILLLITYAMNHPINQIWLGISPSIQMLSSYLIIYRVVQGRAWTTDTWTGTRATQSFRFNNTSYAGQSDTRVARSNGEGPYQLGPMGSGADAKMSAIQVLKSTEVNSDQASWKSGKEDAV
ncbi:hypothetical protein EIP91_012376 [Steccherinum ochraceum]|uniref:Uncharacterized protein n=1 Tax=Steccherinum ochraceum TaxID=92696 RepID=A0A4R0RQ24_9APHY|nr:hypothetical protein EIP91_012376 [Steccherinum ochraceum]